jgi:hypothetical protein
MQNNTSGGQDAGSTEPYVGHTEEARRRQELTARIERGHATVLPGALRGAFGGEATAVALPDGKYALQPVTLGMAANLERIKSPLLDVVRIMREVFQGEGEPSSAASDRGEDTSSPSNDDRLKRIKEKVAELKFEEEQIAETVFVFTRPQKRVRKLLDTGREKFREVVMDELGDKLHPAQMAALQRACSQHYVASFATIIGYGTPPPGDGAVVFPPPSPGDATGSVGG